MSDEVEKIWIVTKGAYSDFHIEKVFSTEQKAKDFVGEDIELKVEEWELDNDEGKHGVQVYVRSISEEGAETPGRYVAVWYEVVDEGFRGRAIGDYSYNLNQFHFRGESAESPEHALKLAAELRQKWLRNGSPKPESMEEFWGNERYAFLRGREVTEK